MTDVFISYSRKDKGFVQTLDVALEKINRNTWVDWDDIPLSADWWKEIQAGIEAAETFIFVISPNSVESKVCRDEIEYAVKLNKRLVPVVRDDSFDKNRIHPDLSKRNWLFFREEDNFEEAFLSLIKTLDTDLEYVRTHTRLLLRAIEWDDKGRTDDSYDLLLRGRDFEDAKDWLDKSLDENKNPPPSVVTAEYIESSEFNYEFLKNSLEKEEPYNSLKNETLKKYVQGYLVERKQSIESDIKEEENRRISTTGDDRNQVSEYESELHAELEIINTLLGEQTRWHPQSAVKVGFTDGYERFPQYKFPCCQKTVVMPETLSGPSQLRADGCEEAPR